MINKQLKIYIETEVLPNYQKNEEGHGLIHIEYVINRSLKFAKTIADINYDMVYVIAAYHDIGHHIDRKNHEKVSAEMLLADQNLKNYFTEEQMKIMADAVYDHRASLEYEPRSIYGKIVSSADRNTNIDDILKRTYKYRLKHMSNSSLDDIIENSRKHILDKFGKNGYAKEKIYFEDKDYEKYLNDCDVLASNPEQFRKKYIEVNKLDKEILKQQISGYTPFNEQEEKDKIAILEFTNSFEDVVTRKNIFGHLTASAFVVNEDFTKTLLVHHNIFGGFIYPGGHADGEYDLLSVAIREVGEETGLDVVPFSKEIFSMQALPIEGHVKRGKYVSSHIHYDILYLLVAKNTDMDKIRVLENENSEVKWCDLEESYNEDAVDWVRPVNKKIVQKVKRLER